MPFHSMYFHPLGIPCGCQAISYIYQLAYSNSKQDSTVAVALILYFLTISEIPGKELVNPMVTL